jgi:hypothetical protein
MLILFSFQRTAARSALAIQYDNPSPSVGIPKMWLSLSFPVSVFRDEFLLTTAEDQRIDRRVGKRHITDSPPPIFQRSIFSASPAASKECSSLIIEDKSASSAAKAIGCLTDFQGTGSRQWRMMHDRGSAAIYFQRAFRVSRAISGDPAREWLSTRPPPALFHGRATRSVWSAACSAAFDHVPREMR